MPILKHTIVERVYVFETGAERVFRALLDAAAVGRSFAPLRTVAIEARQGGRITFDDPEFGRVAGKVGDFVPGVRLSWRFAQNWPTVLSFDFVERNNRTAVRVTHSGFGGMRGERPNINDEFGQRWDAWMSRLKAWLETGRVPGATPRKPARSRPSPATTNAARAPSVRDVKRRIQRPARSTRDRRSPSAVGAPSVTRSSTSK
ncbi:MAG: SRPBCC domain-containing protein [Actinobacteria bacterium]|nr:SRPBCC domain-containing protein [Actinomycetota bacterium]